MNTNKLKVKKEKESKKSTKYLQRKNSNFTHPLSPGT